MTEDPFPGVTLEAGGLTLRGFSRSGYATYLEVPELDLCFDIGACAARTAALGHLALSHGHPDHSGALLLHRHLRALTGREPGAYFVPAPLVRPLKAFAAAADRLRAEPPPPFAPVGLAPGDAVPFGRRRTLHAFAVSHRGAPSLGYRVTERRPRLKPRFVGADPTTLRRAREAGEVLTVDVETPRIAFIGDCDVETVRAAAPHLWDAPVVVLEATYLRREHLPQADRWGHTHLAELAPELDAHLGRQVADQVLVLKHFSLRYGSSEIRDRVRQALPERLHRHVRLLL
jgi:ribonuclease Z